MIGAVVSAGSIWRGSARSANATGMETATARPVATAVRRRSRSPARIRSRSALAPPGRSTANSAASGASGSSHAIPEPLAALRPQITTNVTRGGASGRRCHRIFDASTVASADVTASKAATVPVRSGRIGLGHSVDRSRRGPRPIASTTSAGTRPPSIHTAATTADGDGHERHWELHVPTARQHGEQQHDREDRGEDERALDGVEDASGGERQQRHDQRQHDDA